MEGTRNTDTTVVRYALLKINGSGEDGGQERKGDDEERENRHHVGGGGSGARDLCACRMVKVE